MHGRRQFLRNSLLGTSALLLARSSPFSFAADAPADSRIDILLGEPLGTISPDIYGHFVENLSGVVYDGIWVGENSKVPNIKGIRKELVDQMKKIKPSVVRFRPTWVFLAPTERSMPCALKFWPKGLPRVTARAPVSAAAAR